VNVNNYKLNYIHIPDGGLPEPSREVAGGITVDNYPAIALEKDGDPVFSYSITGNLEYTWRGVYYPSFYSRETIHYDPYRDVGRWSSMKMDKNGYPHISYYDRTYGALMYITMDENGWRSEEFVDNQYYAGRYTSLALDSYGRPHISYLTYLQAPGCAWTSYKYILKYAYKDENGYWQTEVVDDSGCAGLYSSIALDKNNNVHISYYDRQYESNGNLMYAYKSVLTENPTWQIDTVEEVGDVGLDTSLALDADGIPHIAYYDGINKRLKYAVMQVSYSGLIGNKGCAWGSPDCNVCARDVVNTFNSLDRHGDILAFNLGNTPDPTWDDWDDWHHHWQGVQRIMAGDGQYFIVSQDSANPLQSIFSIVQMGTRNTDGLRFRSNLLLWHYDFDETIPAAIDYARAYKGISTENTHPGGIQAMGDYLAVGTGDEVRIYNIHSPLASYGVGQIISRGDKSGSTTALAQLWDGTFLLVVSDSDAKSLDFYKSTGTTMENWNKSFYEWVPSKLIWDRNKFFYGWDTFQSINLVTDCGTGKLYLIGTGNLDKTANCEGKLIGKPCLPNGQDWASLYEINQQGNQVTLKKVAERSFFCEHGNKDYCNFDAAAGIFVDADHQLYLYSTEHASNGSRNSVKMKEFRPVPHGSCTKLEDSWVKLTGSDRTIMIDYLDYSLRDYANFKEVEGFNDEAFAAIWCIPRDYSFFLYEHKDFKGEILGLRGTGGVRYGLLGTFVEEISSGRFLYDPSPIKRLDPSTNSQINYLYPNSLVSAQGFEFGSAQDEIRSIDITVPQSAVTEPMTMTLTPQSPPTQKTDPLGFAGYGFYLDIYDGPVVRETFVFSAPLGVTIKVADGDFSGLDHATVDLYYWDLNTEQWVPANTTCPSGQSGTYDINSETYLSSLCKLGEYALLGELVPTSVLVDEAHDDLLTLSWTRAQQISASQPGSEPEWYFLGALEISLEDEFSFEQALSTPLTDDFLENYDVLMVPNYQGYFSTEEVTAIRRYVAGGGGLVLIGDCSFDNPNPELAASYGIKFDQHCLFGPTPDLNGDIVISQTLGHPSTGDTGTISLNWSQSLEISGLAELVSVSREDTWRDEDWNNTYDEGIDTVGDLPIGAVFDTGCGRVVDLGDNAFSDSSLDWTDNDVYMRNLLRWVSSGKECALISDLQPTRILVDEAHNNQLSLDWTRAQELADEWGISEYPEFAHLGDLQEILSAEFDLERTVTPITKELLEKYEALIVPLYHTPYTFNEISAVRDFVSGGGGLILLGDIGWEIPNPELISLYGITINPIGLLAPLPNLIADFNAVSNSTHPAVTGNLNFHLDYTEALELTGSSQSIANTAYNDAWADQDWDDLYDPGEEGIWDVAAARELVCGRVVVLADNTFSNYFLEHSNNQAFLRSILRWVTEERICSFDVFLPQTNTN
jgi:hypothetical protein